MPCHGVNNVTIGACYYIVYYILYMDVYVMHKLDTVDILILYFKLEDSS